MKYKLIKFAVPILLLSAFLFNMTALAATSSATIDVNDSGAFGSNYQFSGNVTVSGSNKSVSIRYLYVAGQTKGHTLGHTFSELGMEPNSSTSRVATNVTEAYYHVILDPAGPNKEGCKGSGKIVD